MGLTVLPQMPHSKGLDRKVSEPEDLQLLAQSGEGARGVQVGRGLRSRTTTVFPTTAPYKWEKGEVNCCPRQILLWPHTQFPDALFLSVSIV